MLIPGQLGRNRIIPVTFCVRLKIPAWAPSAVILPFSSFYLFEFNYEEK